MIKTGPLSGGGGRGKGGSCWKGEGTGISLEWGIWKQRYEGRNIDWGQGAMHLETKIRIKNEKIDGRGRRGYEKKKRSIRQDIKEDSQKRIQQLLVPESNVKKKKMGRTFHHPQIGGNPTSVTHQEIRNNIVKKEDGGF